MYYHIGLGNTSFGRLRKLQVLIGKKHVQFAGYTKAQIFGRLNCKAGKRMKPENRVFFTNAAEALSHGYRPCGICMRVAYLEWKKIKSPTLD